MQVEEDKTLIGCEEWCSLPDIGLPAVKARVDSGAKTSSLHAYNVQIVERDGQELACFDVHPIQANRKVWKRCEAPFIGRREVRSSSGHVEKRPIILTNLKMNGETWPIYITLTNRDSMGYRMLLGREAMSGRLIVDPERSFLLGKLSSKKAESYYHSQAMKKKGMKILVLASNPDLYSNQRLLEAGQQRGHEMVFVNVRYCYMDINSSEAKVHYRGGEILDDVDAVIPRLKPSMTFYGCAVARHFQLAGTFCLNDADAISRSRDKLRALQLLAEQRIGMPVTGFAKSPEDTKDLIRMVGGAPLVVKLLEGTQGRGVVLAETNKAAESVTNAFKSLNANILVQEFVKEAQGRDIRCFVIDGKVVGSIERRAAEGEFRANLHMGGTAASVKITAQERKIAIRAARAMGLKVAGVDIIRSGSGPKVLEVNSSPGLQGIEDVTGKDIAGMMIESVERYA